MKIKGKVVETIVFQKEVEIEVPDTWMQDDDDPRAQQAVRDEAYRIALSDLDIEHGTGWEAIDTLDVDITWEKVE